MTPTQIKTLITNTILGVGHWTDDAVPIAAAEAIVRELGEAGLVIVEKGELSSSRTDLSSREAARSPDGAGK